MRLVAIGDVHGCVEELRALLSRVAPRDGDRFVLLGDLVDRGPDSLGALRVARALVDAHPGSVALLGNHEDKLRKRLSRGAPPLEPWAGAAEPEELAWLASRPLWARDRARGLVFVHGGFFPRWFEHYGPLPEAPEALAEAPRKQRERAHRFPYVRHVDRRGDMVALGEESPETRGWAEAYDGREGFACFGHEPYADGPRRFPHALGLDTGCVFGGALTAAVWEDGEGAQARLVSEPARRAYAERREED